MELEYKTPLSRIENLFRSLGYHYITCCIPKSIHAINPSVSGWGEKNEGGRNTSALQDAQVILTGVMIEDD